mmetsp:Transcript_36351/g.41790  ORF Transcript_36351/g.41790 Transcript_36351/m.41790 type:complete len:113 (+) Transcript_36351:595-933(+)
MAGFKKMVEVNNINSIILHSSSSLFLFVVYTSTVIVIHSMVFTTFCTLHVLGSGRDPSSPPPNFVVVKQQQHCSPRTHRYKHRATPSSSHASINASLVIVFVCVCLCVYVCG